MELRGFALAGTKYIVQPPTSLRHHFVHSQQPSIGVSSLQARLLATTNLWFLMLHGGEQTRTQWRFNQGFFGAKLTSSIHSGAWFSSLSIFSILRSFPFSGGSWFWAKGSLKRTGKLPLTWPATRTLRSWPRSRPSSGLRSKETHGLALKTKGSS